MQHLTRKYAGRHIIAVAHFGVILTQVQMAMGVPAQQVLAHKIDNLSVTDITWETDKGRVGTINRLVIPHSTNQNLPNTQPSL